MRASSQSHDPLNNTVRIILAIALSVLVVAIGSCIHALQDNQSAYASEIAAAEWVAQTGDTDDADDDDEEDAPKLITLEDQTICVDIANKTDTQYASWLFDDYGARFQSVQVSDPTICLATLKSNGSYISVRPLKTGKCTITCTGVGYYDTQYVIKLNYQFYKFDLGKKSFNGYYYVMYPGMKAQVTCKGLSGLKWESSNTYVAKVSKTGKITAGKTPGASTITVSSGDFTRSFTVENTYKTAYRAVKNAFADMKTKLKYDQGRRMSNGYRDCSSFVSRCYWDTSASPKRRLFAICGESGKSWAGTAASQASWMNNTGRCIAKKAIDESQLLAGDTIHFQTNYAGVNNEYRHIDHVALYIGDGMYMHTGGWGGKGTVGVTGYWSKDKRVKFIGRPCAQPILNYSQVTLNSLSNKSSAKTKQLKVFFNNDKVKWKSSKPGVAKVSSKGKVTAKRAGTTIISAKAAGKTFKCRVIVK